jgi:hypothetical protein
MCVNMPTLHPVELRPGSPKLAKAARPTGWLLLLCLLLCVWEPLNLALSASSAISAITVGQTGRGAFLAFRLLVAGIGVAAGIAIWNGRMHGLTLAKLALGLAALSAIIRFAWFPGNVPPGLRLPLALLSVAFNAAWYVYLTRLRAKG